MKNARIIAALALLVFSFSGCANANRSEVPAPSSQETVIAKSEQSTVSQENTTASVSESTEIPAESMAEPKTEKAQPQEPEPPAAEEPTEPEFDIQTWIDYANAYAESMGLRLESSAVDCWDNPISAGAHCSYLERDIQSRLNRYARDEDITDVWIWAEARSDGKYDLYIGYA